MPPFVFNTALVQRIELYLSTTSATARQIAKHLDVDKHIVNQHLHRMDTLLPTNDRIPVWTMKPDDYESDEECCEVCGNAAPYGRNLNSSYEMVCDDCASDDEEEELPAHVVRVTLNDGVVGYAHKDQRLGMYQSPSQVPV